MFSYSGRDLMPESRYCEKNAVFWKMINLEIILLRNSKKKTADGGGMENSDEWMFDD